MTPPTAESFAEQHYSKAEVGKLRSAICFVNSFSGTQHVQMNNKINLYILH